MKTERYAGACVSISCVGGFILGVCNQYMDTPVLRAFHPFLIGAVIALAYGLYVYLCTRAYKREKEMYKELLDRTLTQKTSDGYTLNPEDIYEAVEKLGYLEHEMKWRIML